MRRLLIWLVVVAVLLIGLDRGGVYVAERATADTLRSSQHLATDPDVTIDGFPFLTQLATGHYDRITVLAHDVVSDSSGPRVRFGTLRVVLNTLTVSRDFTNFHAATASATAVIGYPELSRVLGVDARYSGQGRIRIAKAVTVLGRQFEAGLTVRPALANGALRFATAGGAGALPSQAVDAVRTALEGRVAFGDLPFQISATSLDAGADGLHLALSGSDLSYSR